jgi:hypothetical protein
MSDETDSELVARDETEDAGGDPACWAHLLCPECGAMLVDGVVHAADCPAG